MSHHAGLASGQALVAAGGVLGAIAITATTPFGRDLSNAMATETLLLAFTVTMLLRRADLTDATVVFMAWFLVYQVVIPLVYVTEAAWVSGGDFFAGNWDLVTRGNLYGVGALVAYAAGLRIGRVSRPRASRPVEWLTPRVAERSTVGFVVIAGVSWLVMWVRYGMPLESLLGWPPDNRTRTLVTEGGFQYFLEFLFAANLALLTRSLSDATRRWSLLTLGLLTYVYFVNGLVGSRLVLVAAPVSLLVFRALTARRNPTGRDWLTGSLRVIKLGVLGLTLFVASTTYGYYRAEKVPGDSWTLNRESAMFLGANTFDTALTYYMVLDRVPRETDYWRGKSLLAPVLLRIPTLLFRTKYDYLWAARQFTLQFYGYDQDLPGTVARSPSMFAEAYLNFGAWGIFGLMLAFGVLNERWSARVRSPGTNLFRVVYVVYLCYFLPFAFKAGVISAISYVDSKLLPLFLLVFVLHQPERAGSQRPDGGKGRLAAS